MRQKFYKELSTSEYLPYLRHVDAHTVSTTGDCLIQVVRLTGVAHETADEQSLITWKTQLNTLLMNIARPNITVYSTVVRRVEPKYPAGKFTGFAQEVNERHKDYLSDKRLFVNELYLSVVYKKDSSNALLRMIGREKKEERKLDEIEALESLSEAVNTIVSGMSAYEPSVLSSYSHAGSLYTEVGELFGMVLNGYWQPVPLTHKALKQSLPSSRILFGYESFEVRAPEESKYGAILTVGEYPENTEAGMLNALLAAPFELVLTNSFAFMNRATAQGILKIQRGRMEESGDAARSLIDGLEEAANNVASGSVAFGDHHMTLMVLASDPRKLKTAVGDARSALSDSGMIVAREDIALESAFWSQFPANFSYRPRPAPISSSNFVGFTSFHNYLVGRRHGNQWGPAVTVFETNSGTPHFFNWHGKDSTYREDRRGNAEPDYVLDKEEKQLGSTSIQGPAGEGKTVTLAFLLAQSQKFNPVTFLIDKDRGLEPFVRALDGQYNPLRVNEPTGFNPLLLEPTPKNRRFVMNLIKSLIEGNDGYTMSMSEINDVERAYEGVLELPVKMRRLSSLLDWLDTTELGGAKARLERWCSGENGWVFNNQKDTFDTSSNRTFGFDVTEFLDDKDVRTPIMMYLFHRMEELLNGQRFIVAIDEYWKLLDDPVFESWGKDKLKTIRKKNGIVVVSTQSPSDALNSNIAKTVIEQCANHIFLPNSKADESDYIDGFKLTRREFDLVRRDMVSGSRNFLIKKGNASVVARLDLSKHEEMLAVLSGTESNNAVLAEVMNEIPNNTPATSWLPLYHAKRKERIQ